MKHTLIAFILFIIFHSVYAQNAAIVLTTKQFDKKQQIQLAELEGWVFKEGSSPDWADPDFDDRNWKPSKPIELTTKLADESGRVEVWFRIKIQLDESFKNISLGISRQLWAATDVYVDGTCVAK